MSSGFDDSARFAERRGQQLLEAAPDGMVVVRADGRIVLVNGSAETLFGYSRSELIGQSVEALVPEAARLHHVSHRDAYLAAPALRRMASGMDLWGRRKDGSLVPVEISLSPLESPDGLLIVAAVRDISDRRATERSLKESEERLAYAAAGANLGLWDVNPDNQQVMVNAIFESQLGYPPLALREAAGKWAALRGGLNGWLDLLHPDDRQRVAGLIENFLAGKSEVYRAEQRVRRPDGSYSWILSVGSSITRDEDGRPLRVNGMHIDISAMKSLQADLEQRYEELTRLQGLRDGLVHMIVHDLRSPLTSVLGYIDLLRHDPTATAADREMFIDQAYAGGSQMAEMISSLLDINRLEAGEMPLDRQTVDLGGVLAAAIRSLSGLMVGRTVTQSAPAGPVACSCDAVLIRRVLENLLGNALKFTPASGTIAITVLRAGSQARIEVADNGPGIPDEFIGRLFDKFFQATEGRARKRYSTGLGLAFCKLAVQAHGGRIGVHSEVGVGSRFWFELP
jgi:PAS domain S-box-containing protein